MRALAGTQGTLARRIDGLAAAARKWRAGRGETVDAARLAKLQEAVADLAAAHHDVRRQLDALAGAVDQLAAEIPDAAAGDLPRPAAFVPPAPARGWRQRLKRGVRIVLRSTLGKLRQVWDAAHPRPPWGHEVRLVVGNRPARRPSLTAVIQAAQDPGAAAKIQAELDRQTDRDFVIRTASSSGDGRPIGTDYEWQVAAGCGNLPATFVESARLLLATEELGFICFEAGSTAGAAGHWIVSRELGDGGGRLDARAVIQRAKRHPDRVLGKIVGGGDLLPQALCQPQVRRRVRRSGPYILPVATRPRHIRQPLAAPRFTVKTPTPDAATDSRPGVLLLLTAALAGGLERVVAGALEQLGDDGILLVVATTVPQTAWSARWRALERFTPRLWELGGSFAEELHADLVNELIAGHGVRRMLHAGDGETWPALADSIRRRWPDLPVVELARWPAAEQLATLFEPGVIQAGTGVRLRADLGWPSEVVVVAMCADFIADQRPEDFVALAHRLRDDSRFRFLLAGEGPLAADLRDLGRLFGLHNLALVKPDRDLGEVLDAADVVCSTAERHLLPHTLVAALGHLRPVVAAAAGDLPRLLGTGPCGITVPYPGDLDGFEAAVRSLAAGPLRRELGGRGPQAVREVYGAGGGKRYG